MSAHQTIDLPRNGWRVVSGRSGHGGDRCGLVSHRGVLHPAEYVDLERLHAEIERRLGFTLTEIRSVYRQGPLSPGARKLRERIDARLLEVAEAGGNMAELGRALGFAVKHNRGCKTLGNALARARHARSGALPSRPRTLGPH